MRSPKADAIERTIGMLTKNIDLLKAEVAAHINAAYVEPGAW